MKRDVQKADQSDIREKIQYQRIVVCKLTMPETNTNHKEPNLPGVTDDASVE